MGSRHPWAKVYVDLRHHPKIFARPDCDFRLWTCLILHAKEHCPDGVVRGLTATDLRGMFGIKASIKAVQAALDYLASVGWVVPVEGGLFLPNLEDRQRAQGDTPEAHAARQTAYRNRLSRAVTRAPKVTSHTDPQVTSRDGSQSDADREEEEDREEEKRRSAATSAAALPPAITPDLLDGWPAPLLAQVKDALASTRKSGTISLGPWRAFLLSAKGFAPAIRVRAAETFLDRHCASDGKSERYLLGIMRGENGRAQTDLPMARGPRFSRGGAAISVASDADFEADEAARQARLQAESEVRR